MKNTACQIMSGLPQNSANVSIFRRDRSPRLRPAVSGVAVSTAMTNLLVA